MSFIDFLRYYYLAVLTACIAGGIYNWKRSETALRIVTILLCSAVVTELFSIVLKGAGIPSELHHHIFSVAEIGLTVICYLALRRRLTVWRAIVVFIISSGIVVLNAYYLQPVEEKDSNVISIYGIISTLVAPHALYLLMINDDLRVVKQPLFWFWTMLLIDGFTSFLYWGLYELAKGKYDDIFRAMELVRVLLTGALYSCLAYAMIIRPKQPPPKF